MIKHITKQTITIWKMKKSREDVVRKCFFNWKTNLRQQWVGFQFSSLIPFFINHHCFHHQSHTLAQKPNNWFISESLCTQKKLTNVFASKIDFQISQCSNSRKKFLIKIGTKSTRKTQFCKQDCQQQSCLK